MKCSQTDISTREGGYAHHSSTGAAQNNDLVNSSIHFIQQYTDQVISSKPRPWNMLMSYQDAKATVQYIISSLKKDITLKI